MLGLSKNSTKNYYEFKTFGCDNYKINFGFKFTDSYLNNNNNITIMLIIENCRFFQVEINYQI